MARNIVSEGNKNAKAMKKKKGCIARLFDIVLKLCGILFLIALISVIAGDDEPSSSPEATAVPAAQSTAVPTEAPTVAPTAVPTATPTIAPTATPLTPEAQLDSALRSVFGDKLVSCVVFDGVLSVETDLGSILSVSSANRLYKIDIKNALENLDALMESGVADFKQIEFYTYGILVDVYGAESRSKVLSSTFTRDTVDKINFDNIRADNIPLIADSWYVHPSLSE